MAESTEILATPEPPHSIATASVDDKGRLKLPSDFMAYLSAIGVSSVFITTLDLKLARIYPISVWKANEKLAQETTEEPEKAERLAFRAKALGGDSEINGSSRVLLPAELRKLLGLDKQQVHVEMQPNGCVNVMSKKVFEERFQFAMAQAADDLKALRKLGFK